MDWHLFDVDIPALLRAYSKGRVSALREDNRPWPFGVLLGQLSNLLCDLLDVLGLNVVRLGECCSFGLVTDENVDVGKNLVKRILEELRDKGCRKVKDESLQCQFEAFVGFGTHTLFFAAASSASALMAGTQTVKWKPPT